MKPTDKIRPEEKNVYTIFGLGVASQFPFPNMPGTPGAVDVEVRYGQVPEGIPDAKFRGIRFQAGPGRFLLRVDNVARYYVAHGRTIIIQREPGASDEEVLLFLMGSVFGGLLYQRGILPLHAGAVEVEGGAVLFAGPSGIGKSTLVGGLRKRGYRTLADDVCAVDVRNSGHHMAVPGFPHLKLWADALEKLDVKKTGLRRVRQDPAFEKYFVPMDFRHQNPAPVRSVLVLDATNTDLFEVCELTGMGRVGPLVRHTYRQGFLKGLGGKAGHFKQCAKLANAVRIIRLTRPKNSFRLEELMDLVERQW